MSVRQKNKFNKRRGSLLKLFHFEPSHTPHLKISSLFEAILGQMCGVWLEGGAWMCSQTFDGSILSFNMESKGATVRSGAALLHSIVGCLTQLVGENGRGGEDSVFNLRAAPTISMADYLARMFKYMNCSASGFVYALVLMDRVLEYNPGFVLHHQNVHRLLLAANVVAAKYLDDFFYKNSFYANVGGVPLRVLNELEAEFMALIGFNAHVEYDTFASYLERLDLFAEVNRNTLQEKENLHAERTLLERKSELKSKDSNLQQTNNKHAPAYKHERERVKPEDTVRTNASDQ